MMEPLDSLTVAELLRLHGNVLDELRLRQVLRSSNGPSRGTMQNSCFAARLAGISATTRRQAMTPPTRKASAIRSSAGG